MENVMQGIPSTGWVEVVGGEYDASYLDSPVLRDRSRELPVKERRPAVRKLVTPDGRKYKLLYVPQGNSKIREMRPLLRSLRNEDFVPALLWSDHYSLLFEFIEGEFPSLHTERFGADLGRALARLHQYRYTGISLLRYRLEFHYNLASLKRHDLLGPKHLRLAKSLYQKIRPDYLRRSLDYFDINRNNFIYDENGKLKLIDAGAFRKNRPTGQFFLGSGHFENLDQAAFWQAYRHAGGDSFLYEHQDYLRLFHFVMKAGQRARQFAAERDKTSAEASRQLQRCLQSRQMLTNFLDRMA